MWSYCFAGVNLNASPLLSIQLHKSAIYARFYFFCINKFIIIKLMTSNTCWISLTICFRFFSLSFNLFSIQLRKEKYNFLAEFVSEDLQCMYKWYFNFTLLSSEWNRRIPWQCNAHCSSGNNKWIMKNQHQSFWPIQFLAPELSNKAK